VYVNGTYVRSYGEAPDRSVWGWRTYARLDPWLQPGAENLVAIRVSDWGGGGGLWRAVELKRLRPVAPYAHLLPAPVLPAHPEWEALWWTAFDLAWNKVSFGTPENGFVDAYMDEGFNEQIYQWDSSFIALFGRYGRRLFPVMETLDNFYRKQRADGYIQRVYSETDGGEMGDPTAEEPMVNPPLFAWVEWRWTEQTGDASRLARVLPVLERYWEWLRDHVRTDAGAGLYYQTDLGSGMDNTPRGDVWQAGWIDMSAQQALAARSLADIARVLGDDVRAARWQGECDALARLLNDLCWHLLHGFYYDRTRAGVLNEVRHAGGFWPLLAGVPDAAQAERLVGWLRDPAEFWRPHPFPALSASHPDYDPAGHYWRGGVWAPTNYMIVQGLQVYGYRDLAREAAERHLAALAAVRATPPSEDRVAPEERDGDYATLWECYAPDALAPGTRWDATWLSRQDFVGWTGLGPVAMLVETVIGLDVRAAEGRVVWHLARTDRHGVERLPWGPGDEATISLVAAARAAEDAPVTIEVAADAPFELEVVRPERASVVVPVAAGTGTLTVP